MNIRGIAHAGPRSGAAAVEVYSITSATESLADDQSRRAKRYLLQMLVRMACFGAALFVDGPLMWVLLAGAILLPYFAVIEANSGRPRRSVSPAPMEYRQLAAGPGAAPGKSHHDDEDGTRG